MSIITAAVAALIMLAPAGSYEAPGGYTVHDPCGTQNDRVEVWGEYTVGYGKPYGQPKSWSVGKPTEPGPDAGGVEAASGTFSEEPCPKPSSPPAPEPEPEPAPVPTASAAKPSGTTPTTKTTTTTKATTTAPKAQSTSATQTRATSGSTGTNSTTRDQGASSSPTATTDSTTAAPTPTETTPTPIPAQEPEQSTEPSPEAVVASEATDGTAGSTPWGAIALTATIAGATGGAGYLAVRRLRARG